MRTISLLLAIGCLALLAHSTPIEEKRLIQRHENEEPKWLTITQVEELSLAHVNFMDITDQPTKPIIKHRRNVLAFPEEMRYQAAVQKAFTSLSTARVEAFITEFSAYNNRYYTATTGVQSSQWLLTHVQAIIDSIPYSAQVSVAPYAHTWIQSSVIARIEGSDPTLKAQVVVLGAHQDSINSGSPSAGRAPGADDNGSGSATLLESFRAILESGFIPKRSIEWQWYAAEEVGLRGSQAIANDYNARGVDVVSMINFDVVGYFVGERQISFVTDFTDADLNQFGRAVVEAYCDYTWKNHVCGYACSDHASYTRADYPATGPAEPVLFPRMHTTSDIISEVNFEQVLEFTKLALGYAIELSEPHA